jgi:hypothetical protein
VGGVSTALPRRVLAELTPSEAEFQVAVITLAKQHGYLVHHTYDSRRSDAGAPDLCLVRERDGRVLFIELKVRATVRPAQKRWLAALARGPVEAYLIRWRWNEPTMETIAEVLAR